MYATDLWILIAKQTPVLSNIASLLLFNMYQIVYVYTIDFCVNNVIFQ